MTRIHPSPTTAPPSRPRTASTSGPASPCRRASPSTLTRIPVVWDRPQISYDELVKLAFPHGPFDGNVRYSITWTKPDGSEGAVLKGGRVKVVDGMKFDVRNTDKS